MQNLVLIDLSPFTERETDHALSHLYFAKATSDEGDSIWDEHPSPFLRRLVELFTERGLFRLEAFRREIDAWLSGHRRVTGPRAPRPVGSMERWSDMELALARVYLETLPPDQYRIDDYMMLVDWLFQRYLPADQVKSESEWLAVRSNLMGRVQANIQEITEDQADQVISMMPLTLEEATTRFAFNPTQLAVIEFARANAAQHITNVTNEVRQRVRSTITQYVARQQFGTPPTLPSSGDMQSQLFDQFAGFNRDWRRVAVTEATESAGQGYISSLTPGSKVKRIEQYRGACGFCRELDGKVFDVVAAADAPGADPWHAIWPGKTNVGRSASPRKRVGYSLIDRDPHEMWWPAAGAQHPHCRGRWLPVATAKESDDKDFSEWLQSTLGAKS